VTNSSDPERGGQQPDDGSREGQPDGDPAAVPPAGQESQPGQYPPGQYQPGQYPQPGPYGQPGGYPQPGQYQQSGEYQQPGQYGQPAQYGQPGQYPVQSHGQPYGDRGGFTYTPYGSHPAGLPVEDEAPRARPGIMILALVLLILSTLPSIVAGVLIMLAPAELVSVAGTPEQLDQLRAAGVDPASVVAVGGGIALALALLYVVFAVLAFTGRNWARIVLAIMTAGFALMTLATGVTGLQSAELVFLLLMVGASIVGTVILFLPEPSRYITRPRR
jgi:hypothetical protein